MPLRSRSSYLHLITTGIALTTGAASTGDCDTCGLEIKIAMVLVEQRNPRGPGGPKVSAIVSGDPYDAEVAAANEA